MFPLGYPRQYPLVNVYITIENITMFHIDSIGKSQKLSPCSIANSLFLWENVLISTLFFGSLVSSRSFRPHVRTWASRPCTWLPTDITGRRISSGSMGGHTSGDGQEARAEARRHGAWDLWHMKWWRKKAGHMGDEKAIIDWCGFITFDNCWSVKHVKRSNGSNPIWGCQWMSSFFHPKKKPPH